MKHTMKEMAAITDSGITEKEFEAVKAEAQKQVDKWGVQTRTPFEWECYTQEEAGELSQAIADHYYGRGTKEKVIKEAIQTATLCLKIARMYDVWELEGKGK